MTYRSGGRGRRGELMILLAKETLNANRAVSVERNQRSTVLLCAASFDDCDKSAEVDAVDLVPKILI